MHTDCGLWNTNQSNLSETHFKSQYVYDHKNILRLLLLEVSYVLLSFQPAIASVGKFIGYTITI